MRGRLLLPLLPHGGSAASGGPAARRAGDPIAAEAGTRGSCSASVRGGRLEDVHRDCSSLRRRLWFLGVCALRARSRLSGRGRSLAFDAQGGEVDAVERLVFLAADAGGEEVAVGPDAESRHRGGVAGEVGVERGVGGVARGTGQARGGVQAAVVGGVVEVREIHAEPGGQMAAS